MTVTWPLCVNPKVLAVWSQRFCLLFGFQGSGCRAQGADLAGPGFWLFVRLWRVSVFMW